jgi:DNA-damage-inducible protein D
MIIKGGADKMNSLLEIPMSEFNLQEFENDGKENGGKYWDARNFMRRLGYETWQASLNVITKSMASCAKLKIDPTEAFSPISLIEEGKEVKSYKLTRFACFLISMHADSKKPEVIKIRAILAAIADRLIEERIQSEDISRIETREDLKIAEMVMSGVAQDAGLESDKFGIFKDAGFRGMYNMGLKSLIQYKGAPGNSTLYDFMGLDELAGNLFRVTQTAARVKKHNIKGLNSLANTARKVGSEVRGIMIKDGGVPPEDIPIEEHISDVRKRIKSADREMKKLDKKKTKQLNP